MVMVKAMVCMYWDQPGAHWQIKKFQMVIFNQASHKSFKLYFCLTCWCQCSWLWLLPQLCATHWMMRNPTNRTTSCWCCHCPGPSPKKTLPIHLSGDDDWVWENCQRWSQERCCQCLPCLWQHKTTKWTQSPIILTCNIMQAMKLLLCRIHKKENQLS